MFNVCPSCGLYSEEKAIDPSGPFAICPSCGHQHRFIQLPLFAISGASGAGKSTLCLHLAERIRECVCIETDILWRLEFATPADDYRAFRNLCLRVAKNVGQAGRPVVLCGTTLPEQFEPSPERRYFTTIHYLALVCDDAELAARRRARPRWRAAGSSEFVDRMVAFNRWLKAHTHLTVPIMALLDTTGRSIEQSAEDIADWIRLRMV